MLPSAVLSNFAQQAKSCDDLGSPFTARLCRLLPGMLDVTTATGRRVLDWPGDPLADALALRLCGGLHALVLAKADAELSAAYPPNDVDDEALGKALAGAIRRNDPFLAAFLDSPPQTNEMARAGMLLPGFLLIARETGLPLALTEIGSSAGLNLFFDRFDYRLCGAQLGTGGVAGTAASQRFAAARLRWRANCASRIEQAATSRRSTYPIRRSG